MKALTFHGREDVRHETVPDPRILDAGDVIVQVAATAICGSDLHVYHERERGLDPGTVLGHEFTGRVVEHGSGVREFRPGQRVFSPFSTCCGGCFYCRQQLPSRCSAGQLYGWRSAGHGLHGAQAELVRVPLADSTLVEVPPDMDDEAAVLLGDVAATGFYCASLAGVEAGGLYVVLGCGPVGLMAILAACELGARRVLAIDRLPERLALARAFGAEPLDLDAAEALAAVRAASDGRGADAVLECIGGATAMRAAIDLVRPGGTLACVGVHTEGQFAFTPAEAYDKNLTFRIGRCPARALAPRLLPLARRAAWKGRQVISHRLPLADGPRGYELFDRKLEGCTKVLLRP